MRRAQPRIVHVALAVIERRGRLLVGRRLREDTFGGYWEFPGGKRRPGETWRRCLARELQEELGWRLRTARPLMRLFHRHRGRTASFHVFACTMGPGRPRPLAVDALRWVPVARLGRYRFPPANGPLLARLRGRLSRRGRRVIILGTHLKGGSP